MLLKLVGSYLFIYLPFTSKFGKSEHFQDLDKYSGPLVVLNRQ